MIILDVDPKELEVGTILTLERADGRPVKRWRFKVVKDVGERYFYLEPVDEYDRPKAATP